MSFIWLQPYGGGANYDHSTGGLDPRWCSSPQILVDRARLAAYRAGTREMVLHCPGGKAHGTSHYPASAWYAMPAAAQEMIGSSGFVLPKERWSLFNGIRATVNDHHESVDTGPNPHLASAEFVAASVRNFAAVGFRRLWLDASSDGVPDSWIDSLLDLSGFPDGVGLEAFPMKDVGESPMGPGGRQYVLTHSDRPAVITSGVMDSFDPLRLWRAPQTGGPYYVVIEYGWGGNERLLDGLAERGFTVAAAYGADVYVLDWMARRV